MSDHYILNGRDVVPCDLMTWATWFETMTGRQVGDTRHGDIRVSTVFLGLDHSFGEGPPLIFETMIFGGEHDDFQERCSTYDQAEEMHSRACRMAFGESA